MTCPRKAKIACVICVENAEHIRGRRENGRSAGGLAVIGRPFRRPMNGKGVQTNMANSNNLVNPNAREAMDRFKMEAASEVGVNLKQGYNGDLTSKQAGSVGGQMVKKMIEAYENGMK